MEKGEQGVINLIKKIKSYSDIFITHGHVVAKHNNTIIDENPSKIFLFSYLLRLKMNTKIIVIFFIQGQTDH